MMDKDMELKKKSTEVDEQSSIKSQRKVIFEDFIDDVTLHGFRYLFQGPFLRRCLWFLVCSVVMAFSVLLFYQLVSDYYQRQTIMVENQIVDKNLDFPTVTICPFNSKSKTKLDNLKNMNISRKVFLKFVAALEDGRSKYKTNITNSIFDNLLNVLERQNITQYKDLIEMFSLKYEDVSSSKILHAIFGNRHCHFYSRLCSPEDFAHIEASPQELCFQFNSQKHFIQSLKTETVNNFYEGLNLFFDLSQALVTKYDTQPRNVFDGAMVTIHEFGEIYQNNMAGNQIKISMLPGKLMMIKIKKEKVRMIYIRYLRATYFSSL